ncbi:hypothetical protein [Burkholderia ambifaria]|nr:hypothetical protein [Burkholderia ambifaria]
MDNILDVDRADVTLIARRDAPHVTPRSRSTISRRRRHNSSPSQRGSIQ